MSTALELPHWDMTTLYPSLDSSEFACAFSATVDGIEDLIALFDQKNVGAHYSKEGGSSLVESFDLVVDRYSVLLDRLTTTLTYVYCFVSTNSRDTQAQARLSELQQHLVSLSQLSTRLTAWIGLMNVDDLLARSATAQAHEYWLRHTKIAADHLMSPAEEELAAELNITGGVAWEKLHDDVTSQLTVQVEMDGEVMQLPMSAVRNLSQDPDRETRRKAYEAEIAAWEQAAVPIAAALNSIKGQMNALNGRRGWQSALDLALFHNNIDRQTLVVMLDAAQESFSDFRRYLHIKARVLGLPVLTWYDLFAPVGVSSQGWEWDASVSFLLDQFGSYSAALRGFANRAFQERWIDAQPRPGKVDGAFCIHVRGDESRILTNFVPTYDGASTLAHELGHGYHHHALAHRTALQRDVPMTLAETASTFCETIVREAALRQAEPQEQLAILEASLQGSCQIVVDIMSRFWFEQGAFELRRPREMSVDELNELMVDTQRRTYGNGLDPSVLHPYMWAVKGHYYSAAIPFYNFPYMFGLLFGLGLYAAYQSDPDTFTSAYDDLLSSSGTADAATLAQRFGIDIRRKEFWRSSLDVIRRDIDRFDNLVAAHQ